MALSPSPSTGSCPVHSSIPTSKRLLPPSQEAWLRELLPNLGDSKAELMLLWNLNREGRKRINQWIPSGEGINQIPGRGAGCHTAERDANPERQDKRHQNNQTQSDSYCCVYNNKHPLPPAPYMFSATNEPINTVRIIYSWLIASYKLFFHSKVFLRMIN